MSLLAQVLTDPGDPVWLEEPGYMGARTAFHAAGLAINPLPVDGHGADVEMVSCGDRPPKLIYVTPSHQYPLGVRMPLPRRLALLDRATKAGAIVLEDDYDSEFLFSGRPVAALYGLAEAGRVIYLGTFSKSPYAWPADRLLRCAQGADGAAFAADAKHGLRGKCSGTTGSGVFPRWRGISKASEENQAAI